jgi:gas vesicle protein
LPDEINFNPASGTGMLFSKSLCSSHIVCERIIYFNKLFMDAKNLIGGLLAGAAIGVAIGMLLAPTSGENTRGNIAKGSRKLVDGVKGSVEDSMESLKNRFSNGIDELARKGIDVLNTANDRLKA